MVFQWQPLTHDVGLDTGGAAPAIGVARWYRDMTACWMSAAPLRRRRATCSSFPTAFRCDETSRGWKETHMRNHRVVLTTLALGMAVWVGQAAAVGPGDTYGAQKLGTVRFLDRAMNLLQLDDGTEL